MSAMLVSDKSQVATVAASGVGYKLPKKRRRTTPVHSAMIESHVGVKGI